MAEPDEALGTFADTAKATADRAVASIDDAMAFIEASNQRIAAMERRAAPKNEALESPQTKIETLTERVIRPKRSSSC